MNTQLLIKTDIKVSQAMPYINHIALHDGLRLFQNRDMIKAYEKLKLLLLICEQNGLNYSVRREFMIAFNIYNKSILQN